MGMISKVTTVIVALCLASLVSAATYTLEDDFVGTHFFGNFSFFTGADPTHGYVDYVTEDQANSWGYTYIKNNIVYIRSDDTAVSSGSGRGSVRITSNKSYNSGLFLFDIAHMPFGCGTWPAVWTVGPNWPNQGEIDVIEGVKQEHRGPEHAPHQRGVHHARIQGPDRQERIQRLRGQHGMWSAGHADVVVRVRVQQRWRGRARDAVELVGHPGLVLPSLVHPRRHHGRQAEPLLVGRPRSGLPVRVVVPVEPLLEPPDRRGQHVLRRLGRERIRLLGMPEHMPGLRPEQSKCVLRVVLGHQLVQGLQGLLAARPVYSCRLPHH